MYRTILIAAFVALLAMSLASAGIALRGAAVAERELTRTGLAHEVLEAHLSLEADTFALVKQLTDALLAGGAEAADREAAQARLAAQIETTRALIAREVAFVGDREDETEELARLAAVERVIAEVVARLDAAEGLLRAGGPAGGAALVAEVLDGAVDRDFRALIDAAVAEEREEVAEADAAAARALAWVGALSRAAGALALALCVGAVGFLAPRLTRPLRGLEDAARGVAAGDLARRMPVLGRDEFGRVAAAVNEMLDELDRRRAALDAARAALEATVAERTRDLAAANAALLAADERRRGFLADVSHELRTPLTIIRGEAEVTLRARAADLEEHRTALERIVEQAAQTARLVDDLLFAARAEAGEPKLALKSVALVELARRACADAALTARDKGVTVSCAALVEAAVVQGDPGRLRQLLMILLENAVRYSHPGGAVEVTVADSPLGVAVRVADQGVGVAEADLPRVFERFFRGTNAAGRDDGGSGLGLAMARLIVEAHGGRIALASRLGEGAAVTVELPASARARVVA